MKTIKSIRLDLTAAEYTRIASKKKRSTMTWKEFIIHAIELYEYNAGVL